MEVKYKQVQYGSNEQIRSINLRRDILRLPIGLDFTSHELEQEFDQIHFVAESDEIIIGVLILVKDKNNVVVKMRQVAIDASWQGKGIGKKLVLFSEQWAKENNFSKIELH